MFNSIILRTLNKKFEGFQSKSSSHRASRPRLRSGPASGPIVGAAPSAPSLPSMSVVVVVSLFITSKIQFQMVISVMFDNILYSEMKIQ